MKASENGRLRVCLISYRSNPHCGGQGVYLKNISRALRDLGHHVEVVSGPPDPCLDEDILVHRLPCLDLYNPEAFCRLPTAREFTDPVNVIEWLGVCTMGFPEPWTFGMRARRFLRDKYSRFDVIHDNQSLSYGLLSMSRFKPTVATIHHPITRDRKIDLMSTNLPWLKLKRWRWYSFLGMQKRVSRRLPYIITVSESARDDICRDFKVAPDKFRVAPCGINTELFYPLDGVEREPGRLIVTNSADMPLKGLSHLLEAVARIKAEKDVRLTVIGAPKKERNRGKHGPVPGPGRPDPVHRPDRSRPVPVRIRPGFGGRGAVDLRRLRPAGRGGHGLRAAGGQHHGRSLARSGGRGRNSGASGRRGRSGPGRVRTAGQPRPGRRPGPGRGSGESTNISPGAGPRKRPRPRTGRPFVITVDFKRLDLKPGCRILDVGCGSGRHLAEAARLQGALAVGADLCLEDLTAARERMDFHEKVGATGGGPWEVLAANAAHLPFASETFDLVICSEVLEHIPDHARAVDELVRVLKPGGDLVVSVPRFLPEKICWLLADDYYNSNGGHIRIYRKRGLKRLLEQAGVTLWDDHYAHGLHSPYWWLKCLVGPTRADSRPVNLYHDFLVWDMMQKPRLTRTLEKILNPAIGKSLVVYGTKNGIK